MRCVPLRSRQRLLGGASIQPSIRLYDVLAPLLEVVPMSCLGTRVEVLRLAVHLCAMEM